MVRLGYKKKHNLRPTRVHKREVSVDVVEVNYGFVVRIALMLMLILLLLEAHYYFGEALTKTLFLGVQLAVVFL